MRGAGQIAELAAIAEPEVAVITNVGPVHVELLGSVEAIAAAKAEVLAALPADGTAIVPVAAGELEPHLGAGAAACSASAPAATSTRSRAGSRTASPRRWSRRPAGRQLFHFPFAEAHNLENALAAVAVGVALGAPLAEMADRAANIGFSRFRGERLELGDGIVLVNDCYNANPVSMRAALEPPRLARAAGGGSPCSARWPSSAPAPPATTARSARSARAEGVDLLVGVGEPARDYGPDELVGDPEEAAELLAAQLEPGDTVLVKGSRSAGLEAVAESARGAARGRHG